MKRLLLIAFAIFLSIGDYAYYSGQSCAAINDWCYILHRQIVSGQALAPYRYRILSPLLASLLMNGNSDSAIIAGYFTFHAVGLLLLIVGLYHWGNRWGSGMLGVWIFAALWPLALRRWFLSPYSLLEPILIVWGLLLCLRSSQRSPLSPA